MSAWLEVNGLKILVTWKNVKRLSLTVTSPDASVRASAPMGMKIDVIKTFIAQKVNWIIRNRENILAKQKLAAENQLKAGQIHVWGDLCEIVRHPDNAREFVRREKNFVHIYLREGETKGQTEKLLNAWLVEEMTQAVKERMAYWCPLLGLEGIKVSLKKMRSRWGSCTPELKHVSLNFDLVTKPRECLNYVVAHELAHFFVRNHGKDFKVIMDRCVPEWREIRKILNS